MAKKKKKKGSGWMGALKWAAAIGGGAVVGAYTVRFVDKQLASRGVSAGGLVPAPEPSGGALGSAGDEDYGGVDRSSPMSNPLAVQAISPVIPVPVAVPSMYPMMPPMPALPQAYQAPDPAPVAPVRRPNVGVADDAPDIHIESAAEARARKAAEFEALVERFANGELD